MRVVREKDWGTATEIDADERSRIVRVSINADWQCSHHFHKFQDNGFFVISGVLQVVEYPGTEWERVKTLTAGCSFTVEAGVPHCFRSLSDVEAVEVYSATEGQIAREDDIVRLEKGRRIEL